MFDNICSLPVPKEIFTQAVHPTEPILSVGLVSGHVLSHRLPRDDDKSQRNGFDKIDRIWKTKRHKGACRNLVYSKDGQTLFSAGSDGIVKAASTLTGQVHSKLALPIEGDSYLLEAPASACVLSSQTLAIGTDESTLHFYDLRANNHLSHRPQQSYSPHDDHISSITPLPPDGANSSASCKQVITTGGTTLALTDIRRGVLEQSEDQEEALISSTYVGNLPSRGNSTTAKVLVGGAGGVLTVWQRGFWQDQHERIVLDRRPDGGEVIGAITPVPNGTGPPGNLAAVGMEDGQIKFVRIGENKVTGSVQHHDVEGVAAIGFDVAGRMISSGGNVVKIWHGTVADGDKSEEDEDKGEDEEMGLYGSNGTQKRSLEDADVNGFDSSEEEELQEAPKKRRKRKRNKAIRPNSGPGIMAFKGL